MAAVATEMMESRPTSIGSQSRHVREYLITGATETVGPPAIHAEQDAHTAVLAAAPMNFTLVVGGITWTYIRDTVYVEPVLTADPPNSMWKGTCDYILQIFSKQPYQTGQSSKSFQIGTQAVNVKQAVAETARYPSGTGTGAAPDSKGLIGLNEDGTVSGVDLDVSTSKFSETWYIADSDITDSYRAAVAALIDQSPVNNSSFRGRDAGEVRILGLTGSKRTSVSDWEVTFDFAESFNSTNAAPASGITGIIKKGWEYLWFKYKQVTVTVGSSKYTYAKAAHAYIDEVYPLGDFSVLGIGS